MTQDPFPHPVEVPDTPADGEVGDPMTEEEAEAADQAWLALHLPPATDEEVAEAERLADLAERHHQELSERVRRHRQGLPPLP